MTSRYLLFHSVVEIFGVVVAFAAFVVAWNSRRTIDNGYFLVAGIGYFAVAAIDFGHALAYPGMGVFPEYGADLPTQFWISARWVEALAILGACFAIGRRVRSIAPAVLAVAAPLFIFWLLFKTDVFPVCLVEGEGLTPFKVGSEYAICAVLAAAGIWIVSKRDAFDTKVLWYLLGAIAVTIASEMVFTLYADAFGYFNRLGHVLKVVSVYLFYKSVVETGLVAPHRVLFRNLQQSEEELSRHRDHLEELVMERTNELTEEVARRTEAEQSLMHVLRLNEATVASIPSAVLVLDSNLNVLTANEQTTLCREPQIRVEVGANFADVFPREFIEDHDLLTRARGVAEMGGQEDLRAVRQAVNGGEDRFLDLHMRSFGLNGRITRDTQRLLVVVDDVTQQKRLEEQARQKSKLESIGTLAGGVAHDFNNLLTGISGYSEIALESLPADTQAAEDVREVSQLAERAGTLTRQLLAFSRKQTLDPMILNVNELVENMSNLLMRVIGEDISLQFNPSADLGSISADPGQVEQVVMNLAVNARDAMPRAGRLTIETANAELDEVYASQHPGTEPGPYVMIAVSDTGCGMSPETLERIYEPFFTTKPEGQGTGLGLSTVYGIVAQHGGDVWVYSEPGQGTTFRIYLPRVEAEAQPLVSEQPAEADGPGRESILLVDDEDYVRDFARRVIEAKGYSVLAAGAAEEAETIFDEHADEIALLLTDVMLPDRDGRQLSEALTAKKRSLLTLYMSGYTANAIAHDGILDPGVPFLEK
ncbi:MAG TPA: MASE3 domain-containing protein, partial [Armatimonadota bacterium]|nr:MASE3 domain-containing protein [Armatimonadota bacterium]